MRSETMALILGVVFTDEIHVYLPAYQVTIVPASQAYCGDVFFLACGDFGRMFDRSFPAWFLFVFCFVFSGD